MAQQVSQLLLMLLDVLKIGLLGIFQGLQHQIFSNLVVGTTRQSNPSLEATWTNLTTFGSNLDQLLCGFACPVE